MKFVPRVCALEPNIWSLWSIAESEINAVTWSNGSGKFMLVAEHSGLLHTIHIRSQRVINSERIYNTYNDVCKTFQQLLFVEELREYRMYYYWLYIVLLMIISMESRWLWWAVDVKLGQYCYYTRWFCVLCDVFYGHCTMYSIICRNFTDTGVRPTALLYQHGLLLFGWR